MKPRVKARAKTAARDNIIDLFTQAAKAFPKEPKLSRRYVALARGITTKCKVRIPPPYNRRFCRACGAFLAHGKNCRVRLLASHVSTTCLECGAVRRVGYGREQKAKRATNPQG
ncbi:MAG: ribonuclease P protein component 4 [archaeon]